MMINRQKVMDAFIAYTKPYLTSDQGRVLLKIEHTFRVAEISDRIAASLHLPQEDIDLAWLIGMLHDVGRFEQVRLYNTFNDASSLNHAEKSVSVLLEDGHISDYIDTDIYNDLVRTSIFYHNVYRLPEDLNDRELLFCNLIRDADKIDILKVNVDIPQETIYGEEVCRTLKTCLVSDAVMRDFSEEHAILHAHKSTAIDNLVGHASLVFELVFPESFIIVKEQGYLEKIFQFESSNPVTNKQFDVLEHTMDLFLKTKL